jgi:Sigma-70 region 2
MQELDDIALLREYVDHASEEAFATLVTRHINNVYSVALRHTRNPQQAEEITQTVFVILAKKSRCLEISRRGSDLCIQCAREAGVNAGGSPAGAVRRFSTEDRANCVAARRGGEQAWSRTGRSQYK